MESHAKIRDALSKRWEVLSSRIDRVQSIARESGYSCNDDDLDYVTNPNLQRFLMKTHAEAARAESAIRRLDRREFDCCIMCGGDIDPGELARHPYTANCQKCSKRFPTTYADRVRIQHSDLYDMWMELLEVVSTICSRVVVQKPADAEVCACHAIVDCICQELDEHFASEEMGGYMRSALDAAPRFERKARELCSQHRDFSRRLSKIRSQLPSTLSLPLPWSQLQLDLQDLVRELMDHEDSENWILSAAFLDDMGGEA